MVTLKYQYPDEPQAYTHLARMPPETAGDEVVRWSQPRADVPERYDQRLFEAQLRARLLAGERVTLPARYEGTVELDAWIEAVDDH